MHAGSIHGDTAAARVYNVLRDHHGEWISGWDLTIAAKTTAVSTRVSEVRKQLVDEEVEPLQVGREWYYRLVPKGQMELEGVA